MSLPPLGPSACPQCGAPLDPSDFEHCAKCNHCGHESIDIDDNGPDVSTGACTVCNRRVIIRYRKRDGTITESTVELLKEGMN